MTPAGFLLRVLLWAVGLSLALVAGAVVVGGEGVPGGVALGAGLGCLNVAALGFLGGRIAREGEGRRRWIWALALALKFALFLGIVAWALWALPVDPPATVTGFGGSFLAVVIGGLTWYRAGGLETPLGDDADRGRSP